MKFQVIYIIPLEEGGWSSMLRLSVNLIYINTSMERKEFIMSTVVKTTGSRKLKDLNKFDQELYLFNAATKLTHRHNNGEPQIAFEFNGNFYNSLGELYAAKDKYQDIIIDEKMFVTDSGPKQDNTDTSNDVKSDESNKDNSSVMVAQPVVIPSTKNGENKNTEPFSVKTIKALAELDQLIDKLPIDLNLDEVKGLNVEKIIKQFKNAAELLDSKDYFECRKAFNNGLNEIEDAVRYCLRDLKRNVWDDLKKVKGIIEVNEPIEPTEIVKQFILAFQKNKYTIISQKPSSIDSQMVDITVRGSNDIEYSYVLDPVGMYCTKLFKMFKVGSTGELEFAVSIKNIQRYFDEINEKGNDSEFMSKVVIKEFINLGKYGINLKDPAVIKLSKQIYDIVRTPMYRTLEATFSPATKVGFISNPTTDNNGKLISNDLILTVDNFPKMHNLLKAGETRGITSMSVITDMTNPEAPEVIASAPADSEKPDLIIEPTTTAKVKKSKPPKKDDTGNPLVQESNVG